MSRLSIWYTAYLIQLNKTNVNLQLREDLKKGVYVEGISEETISRSEEAMEILRRGSKGRHVGSTYYN
jgi:transposase-like protein